MNSSICDLVAEIVQKRLWGQRFSPVQQKEKKRLWKARENISKRLSFMPLACNIFFLAIARPFRWTFSYISPINMLYRCIITPHKCSYIFCQLNFYSFCLGSFMFLLSFFLVAINLYYWNATCLHEKRGNNISCLFMPFYHCYRRKKIKQPLWKMRMS
jgi:hypothetical protein